jgi:hypothetical protein
VGDGLAAAVVVVAFVPCCWQEEAINAMPMTAPIKHNTYLFIGCWFLIEFYRMFGCIKSSKRASNELFLCAAPVPDQERRRYPQFFHAFKVRSRFSDTSPQF